MFLLLLLLLLSVWFSLHFEKPLCPSHPQVTVKSQNLTRQFFFCPHVAYCIFDGSSSDIPGFSWNVSLQKKDQQPIFHWGIWIQQIKLSYCSFFTFVIKGSFCKTTRTLIIIFKNSLLMSMYGYFLIDYLCCCLLHLVGWNLSCSHGPFVSCIYFR